MPEALVVTREAAGPNNWGARVGSLAARRHLELVQEDSQAAELIPQELQVIELTSFGNTANQIARQMKVSRQDVYDLRDGAMDKLGTSNPTVMVDRAIRQGALPVAANVDWQTLSKLTVLDRHLLSYYARGGAAHQIAEKRGLGLKAVLACNEELMRKIGACHMPHAIRRGHELSILD